MKRQYVEHVVCAGRISTQQGTKKHQEPKNWQQQDHEAAEDVEGGDWRVEQHSTEQLEARRQMTGLLQVMWQVAGPVELGRCSWRPGGG